MQLTAIIDLQERLVSAMNEADSIVEAAGKLIAGARLLGMQPIVTEQNPDKLGSTVAALEIGTCSAIPKMSFDSSGILFANGAAEADAIVIAGCEAHICVRQTVRSLRARDMRVIVAADAVGSRKEVDYRTALRAMEAMGAELATVEAILFDWLGTAEHQYFREISRLIK